MPAYGSPENGFSIVAFLPEFTKEWQSHPYGSSILIKEDNRGSFSIRQYQLSDQRRPVIVGCPLPDYFKIDDIYLGRRHQQYDLTSLMDGVTSHLQAEGYSKVIYSCPGNRLDLMSKCGFTMNIDGYEIPASLSTVKHELVQRYGYDFTKWKILNNPIVKFTFPITKNLILPNK